MTIKVLLKSCAHKSLHPAHFPQQKAASWVSLWSWQRRKATHASSVAAGCSFCSPPSIPSPPSQRTSSKHPFHLTFLSAALLWSEAAWPSSSPTRSLPLFIHPIYAPQRSHALERCLWNHHVCVSRVTPALHILPTPCTKPTQPMCSVVPLHACGRLSKSHHDAHCSQISQQLKGLQLCSGPRENHGPGDKEKWGTVFGLLKCVGYWLMLL